MIWHVEEFQCNNPAIVDKLFSQKFPMSVEMFKNTLVLYTHYKIDIF